MREVQNWPRFELVTYAEPTGIPHGWDRDLVALGVPKRILGRYEAVRRLELIEYPTLGPLVRFATMARRQSLCLHPATHSIRWLTGARSGQEWFVNSTLAQFNESVRAVIDRFPFERGAPSAAPAHGASARRHAGSADQGDDVPWVTVGEELRALLRRIDLASVANPHTYWNAFVRDVQLGNYSIEDVLTPPEKGQLVSQRGPMDRYTPDK